jgi:hypothetical protein
LIAESRKGEYMEKKRYQECNLFVKLYRRLVYQIPFFFEALYLCLKSLKRYSKGKGYSPCLIFKLTYVKWQGRKMANWVYTEEELKKELGWDEEDNSENEDEGEVL